MSIRTGTQPSRHDGVKAGLRVSSRVAALLRCPKCTDNLSPEANTLRCANASCSAIYPIVNGISILLNEEKSAFLISDLTRNQEHTTFRTQSRIERFASRVLPDLGKNFRAERNCRRLTQLVTSENERPTVLVIGCGEFGAGTDALLSNSEVELVPTDVSFGSYTEIVCDGHDLPFEDSSFDAVLIQAVLEHVTDPARCVEELCRVLRVGGLVYAETPFMQQVHGGAYDFTRFTHLGHRRLFRHFEEIDSGATAGPGTALAWSLQYFLLAFFQNQLARSFVKAVARITTFWLRYFDYILLDKPGGLDGASGFFFLGRKSPRVLLDRELASLYRGAVRSLPQRRFG